MYDRHLLKKPWLAIFEGPDFSDLEATDLFTANDEEIPCRREREKNCDSIVIYKELMQAIGGDTPPLLMQRKEWDVSRRSLRQRPQDRERAGNRRRQNHPDS